MAVGAPRGYTPAMTFVAFLRDNARWLAAGFLMALGSSFGQTFFIAIFSESFRTEFDLSHSAFGAIYMAGTLASAAVLVQLGRAVDSRPSRALAVLIALGLGLVCAAVALVHHWLLLIPAIFGLRLLGQGMMSHLSQTVTARWFVATRGKALAVAAAGYPTGEALAPIAAVALIAAIGWRETWGVAALFSAGLLAPALWFLLSRERTPAASPRSAAAPPADEGAGLDGRHHSRLEVLSRPLFWMLIPGLLAPSFILTVAFFLPSHIAETKGWAFEALPSRYWIYAVTSLAASAVAGLALDRFGARRCLPFYQIPMALGLLALAYGDGLETIAIMMALFGVTSGAAATIHAAIWAELYGVRRLGEIKALGHAAMVFATAAGPGLAGALIDLGAPFERQAVWLAAYVALASLGFAWMLWRGPIARMSALGMKRPEAGPI
ncbi:MAG: MFS transporter [Pseudomonadota bacterium]